LIVVPRPLPAAPLAVGRKCLIVLPKPDAHGTALVIGFIAQAENPRRRSLCFAGT
jgi:hypothetical protein